MIADKLDVIRMIKYWEVLDELEKETGKSKEQLIREFKEKVKA